MRLYIKQKIFSWKDKFYVKDENGEDRYYVEGELFSWGKKLHLYDLLGNERIFISQKVLTFLPKYQINMDGHCIAEVIKEFTFFKHRYTVTGLDWNVRGDFLDHEYVIENGRREIASVSKQWFTWGDTYEISIPYDSDELAALAVVLVIDACIEAEERS